MPPTPRRRRFEDEDDDCHPPRKSPKAGLILGALVLGLFVLCAGGTTVAWFLVIVPIRDAARNFDETRRAAETAERPLRSIEMCIADLKSTNSIQLSVALESLARRELEPDRRDQVSAALHQVWMSYPLFRADPKLLDSYLVAVEKWGTKANAPDLLSLLPDPPGAPVAPNPGRGRGAIDPRSWPVKVSVWESAARIAFKLDSRVTLEQILPLAFADPPDAAACRLLQEFGAEGYAPALSRVNRPGEGPRAETWARQHARSTIEFERDVVKQSLADLSSKDPRIVTSAANRLVKATQIALVSLQTWHMR